MSLQNQAQFNADNANLKTPQKAQNSNIQKLFLSPRRAALPDFQETQ